MTEVEKAELKQLLTADTNDVHDGVITFYLKQNTSDLGAKTAARVKELLEKI